MATPEQMKAIAGLYVAYFNRAPDPEGLTFWVNQLDNGRDFATISQDFADSPEAKEIFPFLATPDVSALDPENLVTSIFNNMFDRDPDPAGLAFWVEVVESGAVAVGDMVEAIMMGAQDTVVNGALIQDKTTVENKIECALAFTVAASNTQGFEFDGQAYQAARASIDDVNATQESVDAAKFATANYFGGEYTNDSATFVLCEHVVEVTPAVADILTPVTNTVLYWGYNPHSHDETSGVDNLDGNNPDGNDNNLTNEGPEDGGIPAEEFFGTYLLGILAASAADGSIFDTIDSSDEEFVDWPSLNGLADVRFGDGNVITFEFGDGTTDDVQIAEAYIDLIRDLILDEEGNSRFFEKQVAADVPVYVYTDGTVGFDSTPTGAVEIGRVDAVVVTEEGSDAVYATIPPILTPTVNNGGTFERGFTSDADDLIVAGHLDLLHTAIIDGGLGYNTLEIDAKGHFAQPKSLVNIQQVTIENLPNIYTTNDADNSSQYPDVVDGNDNNNGSGGDGDSIIDLSRAVDLENVTITEGNYSGLDAQKTYAGTLNVVGVRNDATLTLQGAFYSDIYVQTSAGFTGDGFTVILDNVSAEDDLYIGDNSPKLNLVSQGGGNNLYGLDYWNDDRVTDLIISGDAHLFIEESLDNIFEEETPALIDASANKGGVDLNFNDDIEFVTFIGSQGNDRFSVETSDQSTDEGADFGDDEAVVITNLVGDNWYDVESKELTLTDGDGDITLKSETAGANVTLGHGNNTIAMESREISLTVGDGDNFIDIDQEGNGNYSYLEPKEFKKTIDIVAGDGANFMEINVDELDRDTTVNVTAGDGGNEIKIFGDNSAGGSGSANRADITVTTGAGEDAITAEGAAITIKSGGGNDTITLMGTDADFVVDETDSETSGVGSGIMITNGGNGGDSLIDSGNSDRDVTSTEFTDGALLDIDTGTGSADIHLGRGDETQRSSANIIAKDGSVITGEDITLHVNTYANLIAADLSGISSVILDDDAASRGDSAQSNDTYTGDRAQLTLTAEQFAAIGVENFSVDGATFNTHAFIKLIISEDTNLSDLGLDDLPRNIDLYLEINDGAQVTMTAEQLHTRIARDGITLAEDGNTDYGMGSVVVNGGGLNFDPFNTNDKVQTVINGNVYFGGSLSEDFMVEGSWYNVQVNSVFGGYDRPADVTAEVVLTIDSDLTSEIDGFETFHNNLQIVGDSDIEFDGPISLGLNLGENSSLFTVDFSDLMGDMSDFTIGNFEMVGAVYGNDLINEVFVNIEGNSLDDDPVLVAAALQAQIDADACKAIADTEAADVVAQQAVVAAAEAAVASAELNAASALVLRNAQQDAVDDAQQEYDDAVALFGSMSPEATTAQNTLTNAQNNLSSAQNNLNSANTAVTNANTALSNANNDLATEQQEFDAAYDDFTEKQRVADELSANIGLGDVGFENDNENSEDNDDRALISQDVEKYTVTVIEGNGVMSLDQGDTATIRLCDQTEDLETIALRGNWNDTLQILDAAWGLDFELQGGGTAKAEGPTKYSNVGSLEANFKWFCAETTIDIFHANAGDTRVIKTGDVTANNVEVLNINATGDTMVESVTGDTLDTVNLTATSDLEIVDKIDVSETDGVNLVDASNVVGVVTLGLDGDDVADQNGHSTMMSSVVEGGADFTFIGAQGGSVLELCNIDDDGAGVTIDGGAAGVALTIGGMVDLDESTLINVTSVHIEDGGTLRIQMTDADAIGAGNFSADTGDTASLELVGLGEQEFALANYDSDISVSVVSIVNDPVVTLHPNTDLTGIGSLEVPEGTILNLTAAQFQQLDGIGTITGDGTVNITDLMQADIDADRDGDGNNTDADETLDLSGVTANQGTITTAEDITLDDDSDFSGFSFIFDGDGLTLSVPDITQIDGVSISGGTGNTINITDITNPFTNANQDGIDASGFDVDLIRIPNTLIADTGSGGSNVDAMLGGLPEQVTKEIYTGIGYVDGVTQNVILEEGVTVLGNIGFIPTDPDVELRFFNLTMEGGNEIEGALRLQQLDAQLDRIQNDLELVTINSLGGNAIENLLTGSTENVMFDISPFAGPGNGFLDNNDLLNVVINGDNDFALTGTIYFNSTVDNDIIGVNDDDDATATLTVNNSGSTVIDGLDTAFTNGTNVNGVTALDVINAGVGDLTVGISSLATVDAGDVITLNGSATGTDTVVVEGTRDFSGDTINADWDIIQFDNTDDGIASTPASPAGGDTFITVTQAQFGSIGTAGFVANGDDTATDNDAVLNLVEFDGSVPFDATGLDADINIGTITMAPGVQTLDPTTDLTGVGKINVPEGGTLNLTAAQYQQLVGVAGLKICVVDGSDANSDEDAAITVNITGLTQAIIDDGAFDLSMILTDAADDAATDSIGNVTVSLAESVELSIDDVVQTADGADMDSLPESNVEFILADGQGLGIPLASQADGLEITGTGDTDVFFRFFDDDRAPNSIAMPAAFDNETDRIDVSGYAVTELHALNIMLGGLNVEQILQDLESDVKLIIYYDPENLGMLNTTNRMVFIEPGVTIDGADPDASAMGDADPIIALQFNDLDDGDEVLTVMITARGGNVVNGSIHLDADSSITPGYAAQLLQSFTFVSEGGVAENDPGGTTENIINGNITPYPHEDTQFSDATKNNLLDANLIATNDLIINGSIFFNGETALDTAASLDVSGTAPVTLKSLDVESGQSGAAATIMTFNVNNTGTGTLTVTAGSDAIELSPNVMTLNFNGTGDIVLDTDDTAGNNGIQGPGLKLLDASGHSGALSLSVIEDVDDGEFSFVSGTGVTTATMGAETSEGPNLLDSTAGTALITTDDTAGWSFDYTNAAAGSQLTFGPDLTFVAGSNLSFDMGPDAVLKIAQSVNFTELNVSFAGDQPIELLDGVTIYLTAAQASGLDIVRCDDDNDMTDPGVIHIIDLGEDPVDLSGIDPELAGYAFLDRDVDGDGTNEDDVTLDATTDLGEFTVALIPAPDATGVGQGDAGTGAGSDNLNPAGGQTLRLQEDLQADGLKVDVINSVVINGDLTATVTQWDDPSVTGTNADDGDLYNSTNVVLLFDALDDVTGPLDTSAIDPSLGRIWFSADLLDSVSGSPDENLFNTLPNTILRIDFNDVTDLDILVNGDAYNRIIEATQNTIVNNLTEIDSGLQFLEYIESLRVDFGGGVVIGDIVIGDEIRTGVPGLPDENPDTPSFGTLTFNSRVALSDAHYLATEGYVNDNDGTPEFVDGDPEDTPPLPVNTVGDISAGGSVPGIDLLTVVINTFNDPTGNTTTNATDTDAGADFVAGTLYFDSEVATGSTGALTLTGANDVTFKSIDTSDAEVTAFTLDQSMHTGGLVVTGGSPAFDGDSTTDDTTTTMTFIGGAGSSASFASTVTPDDGMTADVNEYNVEYNVGAGETVPYSGVSSGALTTIDASAYEGILSLGVISQFNSESFTLTGPTSGTGQVLARIGRGLDDGVEEVPELSATGIWNVTGTPGAGMGATGPGGVANVDLEIDEVIFNAGGVLNLTDVDICITGDIDLTPLAPPAVSLDGAVTLRVAEGATLTISVAQVEQFVLESATFTITGGGTLKVVGEADASTDFGELLGTGTVDLSDVTTTAIDGVVDYELQGAINKDGDEITQNVIGTDFNDVVTHNLAGSFDVTAATLTDGYTFNLALGDDTGTIGVVNELPPVDGAGGAISGPDATEEFGDVFDSAGFLLDTSINVVVDAGYDHVTFLWDSASSTLAGTTGTTDVQVAAGAEFWGQTVTTQGFIATAATVNDGVAVVSDRFGDAEIDMSEAGGTAGWSILGSPLDGSSNELTGSDLDDYIDGGDTDQNTADDSDLLTGGTGADIFNFGLELSAPDAPTVAMTTPGQDNELLNYTPDDADDDNEALDITIRINGVAQVINVDLSGVDPTVEADVEAAVASALDGLADISASVVGGEILIEGDGTSSVEFISSASTGIVDSAPVDASGELDGADSEPPVGPLADVAQVDTVTIPTVVVDGEKYSITVTTSTGTTIGAEAIASGTSGAAVATTLRANLFAADAGGDLVAPIGGAGTAVIITAADADAGGFTTVAAAEPAVTGTGSSVFGATDLAMADIITDFVSGEDTVDLNSFAGVGVDGTNYEERGAADPEATSYALALAEAAAAIDGVVTYYFTTSSGMTTYDADSAGGLLLGGVGGDIDDQGLLFYDADSNGSIDGVVHLVGLGLDDFEATDIA